MYSLRVKCCQLHECKSWAITPKWLELQYPGFTQVLLKADCESICVINTIELVVLREFYDMHEPKFFTFFIDYNITFCASIFVIVFRRITVPNSDSVRDIPTKFSQPQFIMIWQTFHSCRSLLSLPMFQAKILIYINAEFWISCSLLGKHLTTRRNASLHSPVSINNCMHSNERLGNENS